MNGPEQIPFPIDDVRARFPALAGGRVFLDAPGGTQVCGEAIEAMAEQMRRGTSNVGGPYATSRAVEALVAEAREGMADLLGGRAEEIAFGPNMTTLTFALSRALARDWQAGDELVVTRLDHDANISPWLMAAADRGMAVRWLEFDPATGRLRLDDLPGLLGPRTRLVAVGGASNLIGTANDLPAIVRIVRAHASALVFVDAVQSVPHLATDVAEIGCDLLACSPYKFFGPHQGVLWARADLLERLTAFKVRPAPVNPPAVRLETGTASFEALAGVLGTIGYLEWLGGRLSPDAGTRRERLIAAMEGSAVYEAGLSLRLLAGLDRVGARLFGPAGTDGRVPTFAFTNPGHAPRQVAEALGQKSIFVGAGHFYATEAVAALGLADGGGVLRAGLCHYSRAEDVDRLIDGLVGITPA